MMLKQLTLALLMVAPQVLAQTRCAGVCCSYFNGILGVRSCACASAVTCAVVGGTAVTSCFDQTFGVRCDMIIGKERRGADAGNDTEGGPEKAFLDQVIFAEGTESEGN